jgi:hypothetical protein
MRVVTVVAACSTPVKTFAAHMCCVCLHFVRSTGNSPRVPVPGNSVVGTHCKNGFDLAVWHAVPVYRYKVSQHALGLAGLRELILRPPAAAAGRHPTILF